MIIGIEPIYDMAYSNNICGMHIAHTQNNIIKSNKLLLFICIILLNDNIMHNVWTKMHKVSFIHFHLFYI